MKQENREIIILIFVCSLVGLFVFAIFYGAYNSIIGEKERVEDCELKYNEDCEKYKCMSNDTLGRQQRYEYKTDYLICLQEKKQ